MKAGRELDDLMATEVMEWEKRQVGKAGRWVWVLAGQERLVPTMADSYWSPSIYIASAMELVPIVLRGWDSAKEHNYEAEFGAWYNPDWWEENQTNRGPRWWAAFGCYDDYGGKLWLYEAHAPELALAICLAICNVKGIEIEGGKE